MVSIQDKKIVIGICGIGRGHSVRQLPIVETLSKDNDLILFCFQESLDFYIKRFTSIPNVLIVPVVVPWLVGGAEGIDFRNSASIAANDNRGHFKTNMLAMQVVRDRFGLPDLIISDYEPIAAQLAYSLEIPLLTLDQQSKYMVGAYPEINSLTALSERSRLNMFFPSAMKRIACSFFRIQLPHAGTDKSVMIVPPIVKESILALARDNKRYINRKEILVYLSPYSTFVQSERSLMEILRTFPEYDFKLFASKNTKYLEFKDKYKNIFIFPHDDPAFDDVVRTMSGAICTSGHTFLAESMLLGRPVFTIPLGTYEQAYNAKVVADNHFGITDDRVSRAKLKQFLDNISYYEECISLDKMVLYKEDGLKTVFNEIEDLLARPQLSQKDDLVPLSVRV